MPTLPFDQSNITWYRIEGFDHIAYHVLEVDEAAGSVDVLFKFDAGSKIAMHRHMCDYRTLVLQGELRIYRPNGELKEVRPVGSWVATKGGGEPHTEGGGPDQDVIALFSNRNIEDLVYDILDETMTSIATFGPAEFKALLAQQRAAEAERA